MVGQMADASRCLRVSLSSLEAGAAPQILAAAAAAAFHGHSAAADPLPESYSFFGRSYKVVLLLKESW